MKRTLKTVATVALAGFVVASCSSLNKMKRLEKNIAYKVTPEMLEAKGGQVDLKIDATIPAKYFNKKVTLVATPVLKFQNGGEKAYEPKTFQGEKVQGNNEVVPYATEKTVNYSGTVPFEEGMRVSGLYVKFQGSKGKKSADYESRKIADGVIATATMVNNAPAIAIGADQFERITKEEQEAAIYYLINSAQIRTKEMSSKEIKAMEKFIKDAKAAEDMELKNIQIQSYASPDGGVKLNTTLAENRQNNTEKYMNQQLKKGKIETEVDAKYTAQDWDGFQELVSKSNIQDKDLILRVLSMYSDPEQRETEIKNISSVYKTLADEILPQLRRARLTANYDVIGRSDEEINAAFDTDAKVLSNDELLYAATLTNDNARKEAIYKKTVELYPNDYRAYNNLGMMAYANGDLATAENYFKQAASKSSNAAEVNTNLGLIELTKGNVANAETYLSKSTGANTANEALGNLYIKQGQYDRAVQAFGDTKTNSAALAQILAKDYNKAKSTLSAVKNPDAYTNYLMAVVGARTNNADLVKSSMDKVKQQDAALAAKAQNDREFAKYANEIK